jgi:hypothetical protein
VFRFGQYTTKFYTVNAMMTIQKMKMMSGNFFVEDENENNHSMGTG